MDCHAECIQVVRLALVSAKDAEAFDFRQLFRDLALRIEVALDHEDQDAGSPQTQHLFAERRARAKVGPVAVANVAGQWYE